MPNNTTSSGSGSGSSSNNSSGSSGNNSSSGGGSSGSNNSSGNGTNPWFFFTGFTYLSTINTSFMATLDPSFALHAPYGIEDNLAADSLHKDVGHSGMTNLLTQVGFAHVSDHMAVSPSLEPLDSTEQLSITLAEELDARFIEHYDGWTSDQSTNGSRLFDGPNDHLILAGDPLTSVSAESRRDESCCIEGGTEEPEEKDPTASTTSRH